MPDVQTLGVKVTLDGAQQAAQGLDNVAQAGARAEVATKRLIGTNDGLTASQRFLAQQNAQTIAAMEKTLGTTIETTGAVTKATVAMTEEAVAHNEAAAAAGRHGLQLGRLRMELGTLDGRLTGTNTAMLRMAGAIGAMGVGDVAVIAALAGAAALGYAWKQMQGQAEDFAKAVKTSMEEARKEAVKTQVAMGSAQLSVAEQEMKKAQAAMASALATPTHFSPAGAGLSIQTGTTDAKEALDKARRDLEYWQGVVASINYQMRNEADKSAAEQLSILVKSGHATQEERDRALALYKQWGAEIDALSKSQTDNIRRTALIGDQQTLGAALFHVDLSQLHHIKDAMDDLTASTQKTLKEWRSAAVAENDASRAADQQTRMIGLEGYAREELTLRIHAENEQAKANLTLSGTALEQRTAQIQSDYDAAQAKLVLVQTQKDESSRLQLLSEFRKQATKTGDEHTKQINKEVTATQAQIDAYDRLNAQLGAALLSGIAHAAEQGLTSWTSFFHGVESMSVQMVNTIDKALVKLGDDLDAALRKHAADQASIIEGEIAHMQRLRTIAGVAAIGLTAGVAGYQIGQQSGGYGLGGAGGAASGALVGAEIGSAVPIIGTAVGAIVGGVVGLAAGLLGAASSIRKARQQFESDQNKFTDSLTIYASSYAQSFAGIEKSFSDLEAAAKAIGRTVSAAAVAAKNIAELALQNSFIQSLGQQYNATFGAAGAYANQVDAINQQYVQNSASARALGLGDGAQVEITAIRDRALQQLAEALEKANTQSQQNSLVRIATANGNTDLASWLSLQFQHQQALDDAIAQGLDDTSVALIKQANAAEDAAFQLSLVKALQQKQLDAANALLGEYQKQTDAQTQAIQQTQQVVDTLQKFKDSIGLSGLSTLSPGQQVATARQQFQALVAQAMTGDANAASGLPGSAQTLLQASRSYNASGAGYVKDYKDVLAAVGAVQDQFGGTLSTEQLMLKELQRQTDQLNKQIALLQTGNQTAAAQYVQATLDAASLNGGMDQAIKQIHALFPGLQIGYQGGVVSEGNGLSYLAGAIGATNADFRDFDTYYSTFIKGLGGVAAARASGYPGIDTIIGRLHDDGVPGYWTGGAFGGGLMRVGEHGPEIIASGRASVMTPQQMNADVVAELKLLREEVRGLKNVTRLNGAKATAHR